LREQYEGLKREYEPWQKIGAKPEDVSSAYGAYGKLKTEAVQLGQQLGYNADEVAQLFGEDPVKVISYLRQQAQSRETQPLSREDINRQMKQLVSEQLKPVTERMNDQMDREAEFRFTGEMDRLFKDNFKDGLPDEAREAIQDMVGDLIGQDDQAIRRLKFDQQVSDVQKYFKTATDRLMKVYTAMSNAERNRTGVTAPPPKAPKQPESRLDQKLSGGYSVRELMNI
jgi:hypothetical protein